VIQPVALAVVPKSPHGSFPALFGLPQEGVRARFGSSVPRHGLNEPSRREVRTALGDLVHVGPQLVCNAGGIAVGS